MSAPTMPMGRIPPGVRAVFFDAVGTVIHPEPAAADAYAHIGRTFGSRLEPAEVRRRFSVSFKRQEEHDLRHGLRSDEQRELQRWQMIVSEVLDDVDDQEGCFQALYEHFARPASWRCEPDSAAVFLALHGAGYQVGIASNFDSRLRLVLEGIPEMSGVRRLAISAEVGWKKPAPRFFARMCELAALEPEQVLLVGDDPDNDFAGARCSGLHALLFDPTGRSTLLPEQRIFGLSELIGASGGLARSEVRG
jgi:putative hydrolase of the HAD superfamily